MAAKIYLKRAADDASVWVTYTGELPAFVGEDDENLACPGCKKIIAKNVSTATFYQRFEGEREAVIRCPCGVKSILPSQRTT